MQNCYKLRIYNIPIPTYIVVLMSYTRVNYVAVQITIIIKKTMHFLLLSKYDQMTFLIIRVFRLGNIKKFSLYSLYIYSIIVNVK